MGISQSGLRFVEPELNTLKETSEVINTNVARVHDWRRGSALLSPEDCEKLYEYLVGKLAKYEFYLINTGRKARA